MIQPNFLTLFNNTLKHVQKVRRKEERKELIVNIFDGLDCWLARRRGGEKVFSGVT